MKNGSGSRNNSKARVNSSKAVAPSRNINMNNQKPSIPAAPQYVLPNVSNKFVQSLKNAAIPLRKSGLDMKIKEYTGCQCLECRMAAEKSNGGAGAGNRRDLSLELCILLDCTWAMDTWIKKFKNTVK